MGAIVAFVPFPLKKCYDFASYTAVLVATSRAKCSSS